MRYDWWTTFLFGVAVGIVIMGIVSVGLILLHGAIPAMPTQDRVTVIVQ